MKGSRNRAPIKIKDGNTGRPGIRDISTVAVGRNIDEERAPVNPNGGDDFILLGVDHAYIRRPGVNNVNFIALWISCNSSRLVAHLQSSHRTKTAQVDNRNRVALAIADICELAVERTVARQSALVEVEPARGGQQRDEDGEYEEFSQGRVGFAEGKRLSDAGISVETEVYFYLDLSCDRFAIFGGGENVHFFTASMAAASNSGLSGVETVMSSGKPSGPTTSPNITIPI